MSDRTIPPGLQSTGGHGDIRYCCAGKKKEYCGGEVGPVTDKVYDRLTGIQTGKQDDPYGWVYPVLE